MHPELRDQQVCSNAQCRGAETASSKDYSNSEGPMFPEPSQRGSRTRLDTLEVDHEKSTIKAINIP